MTKLNATIFVFTMALTISGASLYGQEGSRVASLPPIAPSLKGLPTVLQPVGSEAVGSQVVSGDLTAESEPLSLGEEVIGQDYFEDNAGGVVGPPAGRNRVFGINALLMSRTDFNDARIFDGGLSSEDVTFKDRGGFELFMTTRYNGGRGWEVRYFGLFGGSESIAETFFPTGATAALTRSGDIHNVEVNYLQQARGPLNRLGLSLNETILGFRYFQFNDNLTLNSNFSPGFVQGADNSLFGFQIGRRLEKQFGPRFGFAGVGKFGVFNNRLNSFLLDETGTTSGGGKDDLSFLGELDLGVTYRFSQNARLKLGYRAIGVTEVGIAERQSIADVPPVRVTDSDGDLTIDGGYIGIEFVR